MLFGPMTVEENLRLGAYSRTGRDARAEFAEDPSACSTLFPVLRERVAQPAATLSGGEQQMLAVGRALMSRPRVLLLDEPSLGLAPKVDRGDLRRTRHAQARRADDPAGRAGREARAEARRPRLRDADRRDRARGRLRGAAGERRREADLPWRMARRQRTEGRRWRSGTPSTRRCRGSSSRSCSSRLQQTVAWVYERVAALPLGIRRARAAAQGHQVARRRAQAALHGQDGAARHVPVRPVRRADGTGGPRARLVGDHGQADRRRLHERRPEHLGRSAARGSRSRPGVRSNDIVQMAFGYGMFTGGFGMHTGVERVGATIIPAGCGQHRAPSR